VHPTPGIKEIKLAEILWRATPEGKETNRKTSAHSDSRPEKDLSKKMFRPQVKSVGSEVERDREGGGRGETNGPSRKLREGGGGGEKPL